MTKTNDARRAGGAAELAELVCLAADNSNNSQNQPAQQAPNERRTTQLEIIREDIAANIGTMSATFNSTLAMHDAVDDCGLIYALRRARAYLHAIAASARDLSILHHKAAANE